MMKKGIFIIFCLFYLSGFSVGTINDQAGTSTAVFLKMGIGARPSGMGGAFVAISDDANAIYWNPAGLAQSNSVEITATHIQWIEGINNTYTGFVYPYKNEVLGIGINYLSIGEIEMRDDKGVLSEEKNTVYNAAVSVVWSKQLLGNISLGITGKGITQKYGTDDGTGFAVDIGALFKEKPYSAGLVLQNIGPQIKVGEVYNDLPATIKFGFGYKVPITEPEINVALDVNKPRDNDIQVHAGIEASFKGLFSLRAGYRQIDQLNIQTGLTFGIGIKTILNKKTEDWPDVTGGFQEEGTEIHLDYAAISFEEFGFAHRFTLTIKF